MAIKQERTCALLPACSLLLFPFSKEIGDVCTQTSALARIGSHVRLPIEGLRWYPVFVAKAYKNKTITKRKTREH